MKQFTFHINLNKNSQVFVQITKNVNYAVISLATYHEPKHKPSKQASEIEYRCQQKKEDDAGSNLET